MSRRFHYRPPRLAEWLLGIILPDGEWETPLGDFEEYYNEVASDHGEYAARIWYWMQIINLIPRKIGDTVYWSIIMLKNYFKIALRNLIRSKGFASINIFGLAVGLTCCILILLWVRDELSYDRFHENGTNLYRVVQDIQFSDHVTTWGISQGPLAPSLEEQIPEIVQAARFTFSNRRFWYEDAYFEESGGYADQSFFSMFSFPIIQGDPDKVLLDPASILVSRDMADRIFGGTDPVGEVLYIDPPRARSDNSESTVFTVTGVFENVPDNSTLRFDYVIPFIFGRQIGFTVDRWGNSSFSTLVLLDNNVSPGVVNAKIADFLEDYPTIEENAQLRLQPFTDIHLHSNLEYDYGGLGDIRFIYIFTIIATFILLIACINFMNLTTARSTSRAKEVGMRKVTGARRGDIIKQFFGESILLAAISLVIALALVKLFIPGFNDLSGKELTLDLIHNLDIVLGLVSITVLTGIIAGSYPALYLSSFRPVHILKGVGIQGSRQLNFRNGLVIFQFSLSIFLIIGTMVVNSQLEYLKNKDLGFKKEHIIFMSKQEDLSAKFESAKYEMLQYTGILNVTAMSNLPSYGYTFSNSLWGWEGKAKDDEILFRAAFVDYDYFKTLGIEMVSGRAFSQDFASDTSAVIVNETAARVMGLENPVGTNMTTPSVSTPLPIIGMVKDYHFRSLHLAIEPLILILLPPNSRTIAVSISSDDVPGTLAFIESIWKKYVPSFPFEYGFLDERLNNLYLGEQSAGTLVKYFSILAILISCLGLLGLAMHTAERRTKEIGIRKALGASVAGIVLLLSKSFSKWVLLANILAWPAAYYAMSRWLSEYAYRTAIGPELFVFAGLLALVIALLTISYQAVKAARSNPVDALKYE